MQQDKELELKKIIEKYEDESINFILDFLLSDRGNSKYLFVGAGLSAPIFPTTEELIEIIKRKFDDKKIQLVDDFTDDKFDFKEKIQFFQDADSPEYIKNLKNIYSIDVKFRRKIFEIFAKLPFDGFLTTNFDKLFEIQLRDNNVDLHVSSYPNTDLNPRFNKKPFIYLHGSIERDPTNLVFSTKEYLNAYQNGNKELTGLFHQIFKADILFVGFKMSKAEVEIRNAIVSSFEYNKPRKSGPVLHYILRNLNITIENDEHAKLEIKVNSENMDNNVGAIKNLFFYNRDRLYSGLDSLFERVLVNYESRKTNDNKFGGLNFK